MVPGVELKDINWLAVGIGVVVNMVLGFIWYAPKTPTGKAWMKALKFDPTTLKPSAGKMTMGILLMVLGAFLMLFVFAHTFVAYFDSYKLDDANYKLTAMDGILGAVFTWLGFIVPIQWARVAWEDAPWSLFFVNAGYYLVVLLIAGLLLVYV